MLTGEQILTSVRQIASTVVAESADSVDAEARWPAEAMRALQEAGLMGLVVPTAAEGLGEGLLAVARVCEILGQYCSSTALCFGMHCVGTAVIAAKATSFQTARFLTPIVRGEHITTLALSEPGTGSHFYLPETGLVKDSSGNFRICGTKSFVTSAMHADSYVVSAVAAETDAPPGQFSSVIVPATTPGLRWADPWQGFGMRGNSSRNLHLDNVALLYDYLLGNEGDQMWYIFEVVAPYFLMAMCGTYLGVAQAALDEARGHLTKRRQAHTGRPLSAVPVLQHRVGELWARAQSARQLTYFAARSAEAGDPDGMPALLAAKAEVADCVVQISNEALTLAGGAAYRNGSRLQRCLRDARAAHVMAPTTDELRTWTGRAILGQPLLGD